MPTVKKLALERTVSHSMNAHAKILRSADFYVRRPGRIPIEELRDSRTRVELEVNHVPVSVAF